jgi:hypothetical protein
VRLRAILDLVEDGSGRVERLLTLEVRNGQRMIVQARGKANRPPLSDELCVLAVWGESGGPSLSRWVRNEPAIDIGPDGG